VFGSEKLAEHSYHSDVVRQSDYGRNVIRGSAE
jgi:hypothetical protein